MSKRKRGGLGVILALVVAFWLLKNLIPVLAGLFGALVWVAAIGFVVLLVAIIISGLKSGEKEAQQPAEGEKKALSYEQKKAVDDTKSLLNRIRINSVRINDPKIRNDFTEICASSEKILSYLKDDPTDFQTGRRVINYYTSSVAEIESKFIKLQDSGTDIGDTPDKLKKNLEEIKGALVKLYNNLFEDDKLDLTVEMKALSIALKRDGLVDDSFAKIAEDFALGKATEEQILAETDMATDEAVKDATEFFKEVKETVKETVE
ncbi:MAG: 5-bromo-4-chloroindolyl phosphate hydrolysis family protein [Firmicutes bacterium]|jgi:5-bromo-4-chloroindolyl phosphate hydrolysis protein|nr:5-bromo-4-chloroindolyl phosphate hydrolysis family protein [Bacillota bacterium]